MAPIGVGQPIRIESTGQVMVMAVILLGALPLVGGQRLYLAAIRHMHPAIVSVIISVEVVGVSLVGWIALNERLGPNSIVGAALVQFGIFLVLASVAM